MNLHSLNPVHRVAIWYTVYMQNGHRLSPHLWVTEEGTPPTQPTYRPEWSNPDWWTPPRLNWLAYNTHPTQWTSPLCGHRSRTTSPSFSNASGIHPTRFCAACINAAAEQGILAMTLTEANEHSDIRNAIIEELERWNQAERPTPWPPEA